MSEREEDSHAVSGRKRDRWASDSQEEGADGSGQEEEVRRRKRKKKRKKRKKKSMRRSSPAIAGSEDGGDVDADNKNGPDVTTDAFRSDGGSDSIDHKNLIGATRDAMRESLFYGCRSVENFKKLNRIQEGSYGVVSRARCDRTGEIVALKQVKMGKLYGKEGFPITAIREINVLLELRHPNIIRVREMVVGSNHRKVYMVMDYMEHDLKTLMTKVKHPFSHSEIKCLFFQLLSAVEFMHRHWYMHRDLKTSNLLYGNDGKLRVCDFGLARKYGEPLRMYTQPVVTLWYRAPELLLGSERYSTPIDMWSVGCIFAEMLTLTPLFQAEGEIKQIYAIFETLGTPSAKIWPGYTELPVVRQMRFKTWPKNRLREKFPRTSVTGGYFLSDQGCDLMNRCLTYDPDKRISAREAMRHSYFQETPLPRDTVLMPTFAATNA